MSTPKLTLNTLYTLFFTLHIPIILLNDLTPLYPQQYTPQPLIDLRTWYVATYKDRFFDPAAWHPAAGAPGGKVPAWFRVYLILEGVYHLPLSVWAVGALRREGDPKIPLQLLIFALETAVTTLTCLAEVLSWGGLTAGEKGSLVGMYGAYLLLAVLMGVDMYGRLDSAVTKGIEAEKREKAQ